VTPRRLSPPASPLTRSLACLALGHCDSDRSPCTLTDGELIRELVETVQVLNQQVALLLDPEIEQGD
jgi:hypothetical protein